MSYPASPREVLFWPKVDKSGDCWVWTAARGSTGYGAFRQWKAHRIAWELTHGPIPNGMRVCHRCDNPPCVRPDHLFLGTAKDNTQDMVKKGRGARGERNGMAKLSNEQVLAIRIECRAGGHHQTTANRYGVSKSLVDKISVGKCSLFGWIQPKYGKKMRRQ